MARSKQLQVSFRRRSPGAGRPKKQGAGIPRVRRPLHNHRHPVHTTLRLRHGLSNIRRPQTYRAIERALFAAASAISGFRLVHFSVQRDHLHLIVEAHDRDSLSRGMQGLAIRVARAHNRMTHRRGKVFGDRYHARPLRTPTEVRNALAYVLNNARKHGTWTGRGADPCSSGRWFLGWRDANPCEPSPLAPTRTWLLSIGWRRQGLLAVKSCPVKPPLEDRFIEPALFPR